MGHHKQTDAQGNTMEQYTTPVPLPQCVARTKVSGDDMRMPLNPEEPSRAELLAAIQGSRVVLESKIETVVVEVNLLQADLRKVSNKGCGTQGEVSIGVEGQQYIAVGRTINMLTWDVRGLKSYTTRYRVRALISKKA
ncbi:hypothetical protein NDU88_005426 [Pleurodeles waltl]|uniref:Uncharacterized protein n=1 Tax=Pleurodeles waltl TaxID=8319 RepID=A0AAV7TAZ4_PLEWA|nr:hypothetical protein NDU88_005426 [Pleurodeles waltl]